MLWYRGKPQPAETSYEVVRGPEWELLTTQELRHHLRLPDFPGANTDANEDDYLQSLIVSAGNAAETYTRRPIRSQVRTLILDRTKLNSGRSVGESGYGYETGLVLNSTPISAINAIRYRENGELVTVPAEHYYVEGLGQGTRRTVDIWQRDGTVWPWGYSSYTDSTNLEIEVVCGWQTAAEVPAEIVHAVKIWCRQWYHKREEVFAGSLAKVPTSAKFLLNGYRRKVS